MDLANVTVDDIESELAAVFGRDGYNNEEVDSDEDYEHDSVFYGWDALDYEMRERQEYSYPVSRYGTNQEIRTIPYRPARDTLLGFKLKVVEDFGGEGQGDTRYIVISLSDGENTRYFRKDGYYASYDGSTWDGDFREVTPVERVVTFYE